MKLTKVFSTGAIVWLIAVDSVQAQPAETRALKSAGAGGATGFTSSSVSSDGRFSQTVIEKKGPNGNTISIVSGGGRSASTRRTLVIPRSSSEAKDIGEVQEDMNVMAHILDKAVNRDSDKSARAMGIFVNPKWGSSAAPQNLYLDGYGAIFFLSVNFPLQPPPEKESAADARDKSASNEWEQARREIQEPTYSRATRNFDNFVATFANPPQEFDAGKVDELKKDVTDALKNAAHIRRLKPSETVTVVITGSGAASPGKSGEGASDEKLPALGDMPQLGELFRSDKSGPPARLVLRVQKSDAEAFQKNDLSFDEFQKKAEVILY